MAKTLGQTYLFNSFKKYEEKLFKAMMSYDRIDKESPEFEEILDSISKRKTSDNMVKALKSPNIVLMYNGDPLDKALKVFAGVDHKSGYTQKTKVFIDCSNIIILNGSKFVCRDINQLLAYIFDAMVTYTYYAAEEKIVNVHELTLLGTNIFSKLFSYIIDYIYKVNSYGGYRYTCMYLASLYYQVNILGKDLNSESVQSVAKKVSSLSDSQANVIMIDLEPENFLNIKTFIEITAEVLHQPTLGLDSVIAKWMHIFGTSTVFALEYYPSFSAMITDACTDAYLNNKNTIEKVVGARLMADYYNKIINIEERI